MNDTPPSGKTPRRRGARKRSNDTNAAKPAANADAAAVDASSGMPVANAVAPASEPAVVAALIDPAPLAGPGTRGDAPVADAPSRRSRGKARRGGAAAHGAAQPAAPDATPTPASADANRSIAADMSSTTTEATAPHPLDPPDAATGAMPLAEAVPAVRADAAAAPMIPTAAASPVAASSEAASPKPVPRQATLRPGELIRVPLSVRWRDLDAFNHVNNSKYLSYLEEARLRWMLTVPGMGLDEDVAPVVAASNLNYKRPIGWPGDVVIELFVERVGTTSLTIGHRIVDATEGGVTYCDGNVVMVWIDRTGGRAAPLPAAVREACARR